MSEIEPTRVQLLKTVAKGRSSMNHVRDRLHVLVDLLLVDDLAPGPTQQSDRTSVAVRQHGPSLVAAGDDGQTEDSVSRHVAVFERVLRDAFDPIPERLFYYSFFG